MSEYNEKICPNCNEINDIDADHCYWCKYKFDYYSHRCEHCSKIVSDVSKDGFCPNCQSSWICLKLLAILLSAIIPFFIFFSTFITDSSQLFSLFALILWAILYFIFRQILYSVFDRFRKPSQSTKEKSSEAFSSKNLSNIPVLFSDIPSDNDIESETQDKFSCIYCHRTMTAHEAVDVDGECFCKRCYRKKWWLYVLFFLIDFLLFGVIPIVTFALGYSFVAIASIIAFIIFSIFIKSIINSIMNHTKEYQPKEKKKTTQAETTPAPDKEMQKNMKKRYCELCGGLIDNDTQKCTNCGKQYFNLHLMKNLFINKKKVFIVTSASIAIVLSIILCFFAFNGKKHSGNIVITSQSKIVDAGDIAYVSIHGEPKTEYEITVTYNSGASTAKGLHSKTTDSLGYASWRWEVGTRTAPGEYTIRIEDDKEYNTTTFIVE